MILLEHDLARPLPFGQVSFKSYLPSKKIYLPWKTRQDLFCALRRARSYTSNLPARNNSIYNSRCVTEFAKFMYHTWSIFLWRSFFSASVSRSSSDLSPCIFSMVSSASRDVCCSSISTFSCTITCSCNAVACSCSFLFSSICATS